MFTYPGNIHIHSSYSDGDGDIGQIASAASTAGLSYVIVTDHQTLAGLPEEDIRDGVVLLVGAEINSQYNHYLALDLEQLVDSDDYNPQRVIDQVREAGGLGFIAHPFDRGSRYIEKGKAYPWTEWPVFRFHGIEIWNFSSHWRGIHASLFKTLYWFFINRKGAMKGPPRRLLRLWDCYNINGHRAIAVGGTDAHAYIYRLGFMRTVIFSYRYIFTTINTYIVLENELSRKFSTAKKEIIGALRDGRCYVAYDSLGPGSGFSYCAVIGETTLYMGGELQYQAGIILKIKTPGRRPLIRLICDGRLIRESEGNELEYRPVGPGVYRIEVYHRSLLRQSRPWIYSNPIYIKSELSSEEIPIMAERTFTLQEDSK